MNDLLTPALIVSHAMMLLHDYRSEEPPRNDVEENSYVDGGELIANHFALPLNEWGERYIVPILPLLWACLQTASDEPLVMVEDYPCGVKEWRGIRLRVVMALHIGLDCWRARWDIRRCADSS